MAAVRCVVLPRRSSFSVHGALQFSVCVLHTFFHQPSRQLSPASLVGCSEGTDVKALCSLYLQADPGSYYCDSHFIDEDIKVQGCA